MSNLWESVVAPATTNGAYAANDIIGGLLTFSGVGGIAGDGGLVKITGAQVVLKAAVTPALTLVLFDSAPSVATNQADNDAYSLAAADAFKVIKAIPISTLFDHGTPNSYSTDGLAIPARPTQGNLYGFLIDGTGVTLTSTANVQIRLRGE